MHETESIPDELEAARLRPPALDDLMTSEDAIEGPWPSQKSANPSGKTADMMRPERGHGSLRTFLIHAGVS